LFRFLDSIFNHEGPSAAYGRNQNISRKGAKKMKPRIARIYTDFNGHKKARKALLLNRLQKCVLKSVHKKQRITR